METHAEVARIRAAYEGYTASGLAESKWSQWNEGNQAIRLERECKARELLQNAGFFPLAEKRILDLGCGTGEQLEAFLAWGARPENLCAIDLLQERVRAAKQRFPQIALEVGNAESLPYATGTFDLIAVFTVFSSILDPGMASNVSKEISRTLARGGAVLWYDLRWNNPFNRHVRGISSRRIERLFPGFRIVLESLSLLPPLVRRLGALTRRLYGPLGWVPVLRTHFLGLLSKPSTGAGLF